MQADLPTLPRAAGLPINRCNLPAQILGGLTYQQHPAPLFIDNVAILHSDLFQRLARLGEASQRAEQFCDYVTIHFRLDDPSALGYRQGGRGRPKANWQRMLRGWFFDTDGREGAVLKAWVESRFGLIPRFHKGPIRDLSGDSYRAYLEARARGLYNTNALEAQLDLVYSYCQYELSLGYAGVSGSPHDSAGLAPATPHLRLYRGVNKLEQIEQLGVSEQHHPVLLLNNLNSFSRDPERASEFGDRVVAIRVPRAKVFCFDSLFPGLLKGEGEYMVIGGLYPVDSWVY